MGQNRKLKPSRNNNYETKTNRPSIMLICCEGQKTEPQYFNIITKLFRIRNQIRIRIVGGKGQYEALIKKAAKIRKDLAKNELRLDEDKIETWVVCDKDNTRLAFTELKNYADTQKVQLAFSDPRFEVFLLQNLTSVAITGVDRLDSRISKRLQEITREKVITYNKTDLSVFEEIFDKTPSLVYQAIENCKKLENPDASPFTTTHLLLKRLLSFIPGADINKLV